GPGDAVRTQVGDGGVGEEGLVLAPAAIVGVPGPADRVALVEPAAEILAVAGSGPEFAAAERTGERAADHAGHHQRPRIVEPDEVGDACEQARPRGDVVAAAHPGLARHGRLAAVQEL